MADARSIVVVHAHPDDECLGTGGTIARYRAAGVNVCLITCTDGQLGEIAEVPELGPVAELAPRLGEIRREELAESLRRLGGGIDLRLLGYQDSGMAGTPTNDDPAAFINQDLGGAVGKVVAILREVRPQVLITYNAYGFYGHPDHIRAHEAAMAAVEAAADPAYAPELGSPHAVAKVYHTAIPRWGLRRAQELWGDDDGEPFISDEEIERIGTPDDEITTMLDVGDHVEAKFAALEAHRTQMGTIERFLAIPADLRRETMGVEFFVLARGPRGRDGELEQDLFEGL